MIHFSKQSFPITFILGFNILTILIFITAPYIWVSDYLILVICYVLFCQLMILWGYKFGNRTGIKFSFSEKVKDLFLYQLSNRLLTFIFIFYSTTFLIKYAYLLRFSPFDIQGMFSYLLIGIEDPNLGYALTIDDPRPTTIPWTIYFLISIINQLFFIIGFISWEKMKAWKKILFVLFLLIEVFFWFGRATNMGIIILITTLLFLRFYNINFSKGLIRSNLKLITFVLIALTISISVFSYNLISRKGSLTINYQVFNLGNSVVDENSSIFSLIPESVHETYMFAVYYLAQGYYHTSLAFDLNFRPTFFLGNNPAIISLANTFGIDVWKDTYVYRLEEKGVDPLIQWHSAYLWYASDVSFLGVPLVMFFWGYVLGFSWGFSVNNSDFLSKIVFVIVSNILLYMFANNSYLSMIFYAFLFVFPLWFYTRIIKLKVY